MFGILKVVFRHMALDVATAVDLRAFETETHFTCGVASLARVANFYSLLEQMGKLLNVVRSAMRAVGFR